MTPEAFATDISGREYPFLSNYEKELARKEGLVIVYGASDDLMEFDGAISDEFALWGGGAVMLDTKGILGDWEEARDSMIDEEEFKQYFERKAKSRKIEAVWDKDGIAWQYKTDIPHATFRIMEGGRTYCIGIVFSISDIEVAS